MEEFEAFWGVSLEFMGFYGKDGVKWILECNN